MPKPDIRLVAVTVILITLSVPGGHRRALTLQAATTKDDARPSPAARVASHFGRVPLSFEANYGQTDPTVDFLARAPGYAVFLKPTEAVLKMSVERAASEQEGGPAGLARRSSPELEDSRAHAIRMRIAGGRPDAVATTKGELPGAVNYFRGSDPSRWQRRVPAYAAAGYADVYPGIDVVYYGNPRQLEYDFVVSPGRDPGVIVLEFDGADSAALDSEGRLILETPIGRIVQHAPHVYQDIDGTRRDVDGGYILDNRPAGPSGPHRVRFAVGDYDRRHPLVIDPVLVASTFLGGSGGDIGQAIAVDSVGTVYVTGTTSSPDFPTAPGAIDPTYNMTDDIFVTALDASGSLVFSTFLGGSGQERSSLGVALDQTGRVYVTGGTLSADFPTTPGAFDRTHNGGFDVFVTALEPGGATLAYSTLLGGSGTEIANDIAVDSNGRAHVAGNTFSVDFPVTPGGDTTLDSIGGGDAFVAALEPAGSAIAFATFLGGSNGTSDTANGIALDGIGRAYVIGTTSSTDFPTTPGAFDTTFNVIPSQPNQESDVFVTALEFSGRIAFSTLLGAQWEDTGEAIAVDAAGRVYTSGTTRRVFAQLVFPRTAGAYLGPYVSGAPSTDTFVTVFEPTLSLLVYSAYPIGPSSAEAISVDSAGRASVTGSVVTPFFPTTTRGAADATYGGSTDAFVTTLNPAGSALVFSTYLGGTGNDIGYGIAADASGNLYVSGRTDSADFPITPGAVDPVIGAFSDAFVVKFAAIGPPASMSLSPTAGTHQGHEHCVTAVVFDLDGSLVGGGITLRFSVTGARTTAGSATTNAAGEATFCYSAPLVVGEDAITAFADTDGDSVRDASEPLDTATQRWTVQPRASCELQLTQGSYSPGQTVTVSILRFRNLAASTTAVELKVWLGGPGFAPVSVVNAGADGSVQLPAAFDVNYGPFALLPVTASTPPGSYEFSCRVFEPVTGDLLSEDRNVFTVLSATASP